MKSALSVALAKYSFHISLRGVRIVVDSFFHLVRDCIVIVRGLDEFVVLVFIVVESEVEQFDVLKLMNNKFRL